MSEKAKPKKTLTPEQLEKMRVGRAKAYEKRKLEREKEKAKMKAEQEEIKKQKLRDIELQKQALQQQKDRIEALAISKKKKAEIKRRLKEVKDKPEVLQEVEAIVENYEGVKKDDKVKQELETFKEIEKAVDDAEEKLEDLDAVGTNTDTKEFEKEYKKIFTEQSEKIAKSLPSNAREVFLEQVTHFDVQKDVSENINFMIQNLLDRVKQNTQIVENVSTAIDTIENIEEKKVVNDTIKKPKKQKLNNNLQMLYNLR
jgi:hypothetical protein